MSNNNANQPIWPARAPLSVGILALVLFLGGLGGWSVGTTLAGAVIAPARVEVESNRQVIQHPDGGVVRDILVRNGDRVEAGEVLLRLDRRRLESELAIVEGQLRGLVARRARLIAERGNATSVDFSAELAEQAETDPEVRGLIEGEAALFAARLDSLEQQIGLLEKTNEQIANRIVGNESQLAAFERQRELLTGELINKRKLFEGGLTSASSVLELERELARIEGEAGRLAADIAGLKGEITGNEITRLQLWTTRREEATSAERELQFSEIELKERRIALLERVSRMDLRAPVAGIVYESQVFAEQAVVQPADPVMYIVPQDQPLIVSARVNSIDINKVHIGQDVALRFIAFDQKGREPTPGQVVRVSADAIVDETTGNNYYAVDIRPSVKAIEGLGVGEEVVPGMPVDAFIRTRNRTALAYLAEPFTAFFDRTFRE